MGNRKLKEAKIKRSPKGAALATQFTRESLERYRIRPGQTVKLSEYKTQGGEAFSGGKVKAVELLTGMRERMRVLQELLYAGQRHRILIMLQAMDTGGKDGTIRNVFAGCDPQGVRVANFKKPTADELSRDFLWRVHKQVPRGGEITIFNRSHYEDVLVVRVDGLAPKSIWSKRYEHIAAFEKMLADEGTTILKFFLHISLEEQAQRLQSRLDDPRKHWKFDPSDLQAREEWKGYQKAYEKALECTSTSQAPWYVIPADKKWFRNLLVGQILVNAMEGLALTYPKPTFDPSEFRVK